jgi:outer membrane protein OmpA-like peptidoglycan-associated protein
MYFFFRNFKISFLFVFLVLFSIQGTTQNRDAAIAMQEQAINYYQQHDYKRATIYAVKAISKDTTFAEPYILLGNVYQDKTDSQAAIVAYQKGLELDPLNYKNVYLTLADLELESERFNQAVEHATFFLGIENTSELNKSKANLIITSAEFRQEAFMNPIDIKKQKLKYNSEETDEYINGISLDGKTLLFTQKKHMGTNAGGQQFYTEQILKAELSKDSLSNITVFEVSSEMKDRVGAASLSTDGRYLFFTACHQPQGGSNCDLYCMSVQSAEQNIFNLGQNINSTAWESQPNFSADGKTMFFASKREGGFGGSDIWISNLSNEGYFSRPVNAGPGINTTDDEMAPFIHADTRSLYFSSKGHPGMGGFDLYISRLDENGEWQEAENLGYPLNTSDDEINMIIAPDGVNAYLSAREDDFNLFHFELEDKKPAQVTYIRGKITDTETSKALFARVELFDLAIGKSYAYAQSYLRDGSFIIPLPLNKSFAFHVNKEGYLFYSRNFKVSEFTNETDTLRIELHPIRVNEKVVLNNIFFETDKFDLLPESKIELDHLIQFMKNNPNLVIEIGGYTDAVGTPEYNQQLSENRAKTVYDFLMNNSMSAEHLSYKGYGETQTVSSNDTEEGRAANRRTEFKIIKIAE